jgi:hypothetical protein
MGAPVTVREKVHTPTSHCPGEQSLWPSGERIWEQLTAATVETKNNRHKIETIMRSLAITE